MVTTATNISQTLWEVCQLGDTAKLRDVYQVVASLRILVNWQEKVFRPWFERYALPLTDEERTSRAIQGRMG